MTSRIVAAVILELILAACVSAQNQFVVENRTTPQYVVVNRTTPINPAPVGTAPGPNYQWRFLPGVGWGWVQDGVVVAQSVPVQTVQFAPSLCPGGVCPTSRGR